MNALSKKMIVESINGGKAEKIVFENGEKVEHKIVKAPAAAHGLFVSFLPSEEYLETVEFEDKRIMTLLKEFSFLCKGLTFSYTNKNNETTFFCSKNGLYDYIEYLNKDNEMLCEPFYFEQEEGTFKIEVAFGYNLSYSSSIKLYTNNIPQTKGTHLTGFKTAFTSTLNSFAKEKKWLKDKEANLQGTDLEEGLMLIINFKMIDPVFKGQNKEELSSSEGRTYTQKLSTNALKELFDLKEQEIKKIFNKALNARKAREAAKKARDNVREKKEKKEKVLKFDSKLADCYSKAREKCELIVVEGDSAAGNLKLARNNEYQAILPVRGKIQNSLKASIDKIQKNAEIMTLIEALGLNVDTKIMKVTYDKDKLRYGKIIIMSDADVSNSAYEKLYA